MNNLGYTYFLKGDLKSAEFYLRDAVNRAPNLCLARKNFRRGIEGSHEVWRVNQSFSRSQRFCKEMSQLVSSEIANNQIELEQFSLACMELQDLMTAVTDTN